MRRPIALLAMLVAASPLTCKLFDRSDDTADSGPRAGNTTSTTTPSGAAPTARGHASAAVPADGCALPVDGTVKADLTLKKGCTVTVNRNIAIRDNATLTIEPGVKLVMEAERYLTVHKGKLVAKGSKDEPVVFTSASKTQAPGDWVGIFLDDDVSAGTELDHVKIEYAGSGRSGGHGAITFLRQKSGKRVSITNTLIENAELAAVWSDSDKGTFARFENNRMQKNKVSVSAPAEVLGSLGEGNVFTDPLSTGGAVDESVKWPTLDAPVHVDRSITIGGESAAAILTIQPKTVLKFAGGRYIDVGTRNGGGLIAREVTFTSANATAQPGDWSGIHLQSRANNTDLSGATIEYAGKGSGARAALTVRAKDSEISGLKAAGLTFRKNEGAAISTEDGVCKTFETGTKSDGAPLCKKR